MNLKILKDNRNIYLNFVVFGVFFYFLWPTHDFEHWQTLDAERTLQVTVFRYFHKLIGTPPEPSVFQAKQSQFSHPFLNWDMLYSHDHLLPFAELSPVAPSVFCTEDSNTWMQGSRYGLTRAE